MINKIKMIATTMLVTGATVAALSASAATTTNVLRNISVNLTVYQQYDPANSKTGTNSTNTKITDKVSVLNTKEIIAGIGAATGTNFGKSASLVVSTVFTNLLVTNGSILETNLSTNVGVPALGTNKLSAIIGGIAVTTNSLTTSNAVITNATLAIGTNSAHAITTNTFIVVVTGDTGATNVSTNTFSTNSGSLTTISATPTNTTLTNFNILTVSGTPTNVFTNLSADTINILSGTAAAPVLTDVSSFFRHESIDTAAPASDVIINETGKGLTNTPLTVTNITSASTVRIEKMEIRYFATNGSGTNLLVRTQGFTKGNLKVDDIGTGKTKVVEDISTGSSTSAVNGYGYIGGTYVTNTSVSGNAVDLPTEHVPGTNTVIQGSITNPIPIVVDGTINVTFLKNLAQ